MSLYKLTSKDDLTNSLRNYNGDSKWIRNQLSSFGMMPSEAQTQLWDAMNGNNQAEQNNQGSNFFEKRAKSINNAIGTTGAAVASAIKDAKENKATANLLQNNKDNMNAIAKKYGFNDYHAVWDARDKAEAEGDTKTLDLIDNVINPELQGQATANAEKATEKAKKYENYRKNDEISKLVNQDRGKFLGSAINTLSTATDLLGLTNGPVSNAIQGGIEGFADELEQNGLQNFDWGRAAQNAASGAVSGAAVGAVNNKIGGMLSKNNGNLFKGGNFVTEGLNKLGSSTALGRGASTLATGAARGAISGAVGGATGAGTSALLNGQAVIPSALQGATQGFQSGAVTGAIMTPVNNAISKTKFMQNIDQLKQDFQDNGDNFKERLKNTWNESDTKGAISKIGETMAKHPLGNSIQNVDGGEQTPVAEPIRNVANMTAQWDSVAKQAGFNDYDDMLAQFKQANPTTDATADKVLDWADNRALQTTNQDAKAVMKQNIKNIKADELSDRAAQDLLNQVSTVSSPVAKANNMTNNVKKFMAEGLTKPEEWQLASDAITGSNGKVTKMYNNLIAQAGDVNTFSGLGGKYGDSMDSTIDYIIKGTGLTGGDAKGVKNEIIGVLDSLPSRMDGSVNMSDSAESVIKAVRTLEARKRNYLGQDSRNYKNPTPYGDAKAEAIGKVASMLEDRIYDKVPDASKVVTPDSVQEIKNTFPGNEKWAKSVDETFANVKTGKDLRAAQKRFVQTNDYLEGAKRNYGTYGQRVGDAYGNIISESVKKIPIIGGALASATNTPFMNRRYADFNTYRANKLRGESVDLPSVKTLPSGGHGGNGAGTPTGNNGGNGGGTNLVTTGQTPNNYNPSTQIYNAIGRTEGLTNAEQARTAEYLTNAVQNNNTGATQAGSLESLVTQPTSNSVYNSVGSPLSSVTTSTVKSNPYFQQTGDYWTDIIGNAMAMAIDADDPTAFAALYSMYNESLANLQKSSTSSVKLTDKQRQANAAQRALEDFESTQSNFGYDVSDIPILGTLANMGGNEYASKAEALALQVGYMLSGATVNKDEAKKIGMAYVPQPRDSEAVRQSKLQQLRGIISDYQQTYGE